jgi:DEAD/DEAH box helicase domain-containing protein
LKELARLLWQRDDPGAQRATTQLLQLAAAARRDPKGFPLVPHRLHALARPASGMAVCLNGACNGGAPNRLPPFGSVLPGTPERCPHCEKRVLTLCRCQNCGEWLLAGELTENRYGPVRTRLENPDYLTPKVEQARKRFPEVPVFALGPDGTRGGEGELGTPVAGVERCPNCAAPSRDFTPFGTLSPLPLSILAEATLVEMPVYPSPSNVFLPARGRLLAFSDSRQEAARLGPRLTRQHEEQLARAMLIDVLGKGVSPKMLQLLKDRARALSEQIAADSELGPELAPELEETRRKIQAAESGGAMSGWCARLAEHATIAELLDAESGESHQALQRTDKGVRPWGQPEWDANRTEVRKPTQDLLAGELAVLSIRAISAEKLGLAEVTYPGLDGWPPSAAAGRVAQGRRRQAYRSLAGLPAGAA